MFLRKWSLSKHVGAAAPSHRNAHHLSFGNKSLEAFTDIPLSCICVMGTEHFHIHAFLSAISACFY